MSMRKGKTASPLTDEPFAHEVFTCQTGADEAIEITISIRAVPLVNPPPRPRHFDFFVRTPLGMPYEIHGLPELQMSVPLVNPPTKPK